VIFPWCPSLLLAQKDEENLGYQQDSGHRRDDYRIWFPKLELLIDQKEIEPAGMAVVVGL
jgi:hypothetical protein